MRRIQYRGGCLCGNVRFEATGPADYPHTCSCRMCQRHSGALTACWVEFPRDAVKWTGPEGAPSTYRSSDGSSRAFCSTCGSSLGAIDDKPVVALLTGVFDSPGRQGLRPRSHSYRGARPRWWRIAVTDEETDPTP
nr:GFA family protein [Phreatobacter oligotrophus]